MIDDSMIKRLAEQTQLYDCMDDAIIECGAHHSRITAFAKACYAAGLEEGQIGVKAGVNAQVTWSEEK